MQLDARVLMIIAAVFLLIAGGFVVLTMRDIPAPQQEITKELPADKFLNKP